MRSPKSREKEKRLRCLNFYLPICPTCSPGISVGGQYALIAIGYTMVYGILRLINFAHGDVFMVAGLVMVYSNRLPADLLFPFVLACIDCP